MIIDSHVHLSLPTKNNDISILLNKMNYNKIDQAILIPSFNKKSDNYISKFCAKYPRRFKAFLCADFNQTDYKTKIKDKLKKSLGKGLKIHPQKQNIKLDDPRVIDIIRLIKEYSLPVMIDFFPQQTADFPVTYTYPENLISILQKIPEATIIIAHAGGFKLWEAFFIARAYPKVYMEFSFSMNYFKGTSFIKDIIFVLKNLGSRKCIFGSDYPEISFKESINYALYLTKKAGYSPEDKNYFFGKTILSII